MRRHSGLGIIRAPSDARSPGSGSSYFQRRVQPMTGGAVGQPGMTPIGATPTLGRAHSGDSSETGLSSRSETLGKTIVKPSMGTAGLNAIAVLTNHPNKAPGRIHRSELPTVTRTHYPRVRKSDFDEYIESISELFSQYEANSKSGYQISTDELDRYEVAVEDAEKVLEAVSHTYSMDSTTMAERLRSLDGTRSEFGLESISEYDRGNMSISGNRALPDIEDIPTIFFKENFDLSNPATFDIVTQIVLGPQTASSGLFSQERSAETSATMHEMLSGYMDTVEAYLTREISRRSPSFFAALSTLEELHAETDGCIEKIHGLRRDLRRTTQSQCSPGLELIRLRHQRENLTNLLRDIELLNNFKQLQPTVDELILSGDYIGALNIIVEAQEMVESAQQKSHNVRSSGHTNDGATDTQTFKTLNNSMLKSLDTVSNFSEQELAGIVLRDMREFVDDGLQSSTNGILSQSQTDIYQANLSMQLTPFICGLVKIGGIEDALKTYRKNMMSETSSLIESLYPSSFPRSKGHAMFNDTTQQKTLGAAVRSLTFDQFKTLLQHQQELLLLIISHIAMVRRAMLSILDDNRPQSYQPDKKNAIMAQREPATTATTPANGSPSLRYVGTTGRGRSYSPSIGRNSFNLSSALPNQHHSLSMRYETAKSDILRSLNDTFDEFMDVAHMRCAKLLNHRSEQNARLSLTGFYTLYSSIWQFIMKYEELGGKMCFGLRGTLTAQAKAFLNNFHTEKSRQIHILIENEQWAQAEVPIDFQNLVNQVIDAAVPHYGDTDSGAEYENNPLLIDIRGQTDLSAHGAPSTNIHQQSTPSMSLRPSSSSSRKSPAIMLPDSPKSSTKNLDSDTSASILASNTYLMPRTDSDAASIRSVDTTGIGLMRIGDEEFHVVGCSLVLVKSVVEYLQCATNIPMLVTDVLQRLVELFKAFNSRTCQVVLGAGAMRSAGLKNISAKHLALASESLALCTKFIPYVKECLRRVMSNSQMVLLGQLDRTVDDFNNHQKELHRKLVSIMSDRGDYHCRMLAATKWDELEHAAQPPVSAIDALAKEVRKLHKVLRKYLPISVVRSVFAQIYKMYEAKLTSQYQKLRITSGEGKRQLMVNSQYLLRRLSALDASQPVNMGLEIVVNNIDLVKPYQPSTPPTSTSGSNPAKGHSDGNDVLAAASSPKSEPNTSSLGLSPTPDSTPNSALGPALVHESNGDKEPLQ